MQSSEESKQPYLPPATPSNTPFKNSKFIKWKPFKQGSYNLTYMGYANEAWWIQKFSKKISDFSIKMSNPDRFIRKNLRINQDRLPAFIDRGYRVQLKFPPKDNNLAPHVIYLYQHSLKDVWISYLDKNKVAVHECIHGLFYYELWLHAIHAVRLNILPLQIENAIIDFLKLKRDSLVMPFAGQELPSDERISEYVINVYKDERNILIDACIPGNLLVYEGQIICVGFDCALEKGSEISDTFLSDKYLVDRMHEFLHSNLLNNINPLTVETCLTLLYLEEHILIQNIQNIFLTPQNLVVLEHFRKMKVLLKNEHLTKIQLLTETYPNFKDYMHFITPHFLSQIPMEMEKNVLNQLIHDLFLREAKEIANDSVPQKLSFRFFQWDRTTMSLTLRDKTIHHGPK
ncbi:MAG: hypothetical protein EBQ95_01820 [Gammaproteobacteria bacterium]|nr:hypothetical protein [Gammaproteobacteria bacterium]